MLLKEHPADILPPVFVAPRRDSAPSEVRESRVEVDGSNVTAEVLSNRSSPANAPARPTLPMRSKSTWGRDAKATLEKARRAASVVILVVGEFLWRDDGAISMINLEHKKRENRTEGV